MTHLNSFDKLFFCAKVSDIFLNPAKYCWFDFLEILFEFRVDSFCPNLVVTYLPDDSLYEDLVEETSLLPLENDIFLDQTVLQEM